VKRFEDENLIVYTFSGRPGFGQRHCRLSGKPRTLEGDGAKSSGRGPKTNRFEERICRRGSAGKYGELARPIGVPARPSGTASEASGAGRGASNAGDGGYC